MTMEVMDTAPATSTGLFQSHRKMSGVEHEHQFVCLFILRINNERFPPPNVSYATLCCPLRGCNERVLFRPTCTAYFFFFFEGFEGLEAALSAV